MRYVKTVAALLLLLVFAFAVFGCSLANKALDKFDLGKYGEKVSRAWEEVGKDVVSQTLEEALYTVGLKNPAEWPQDETASEVPKPESGEIRTTLKTENGMGGRIYLHLVSYNSFSEYISLLFEKGFSAEDTIDEVLLYRRQALTVGLEYKRADELLCIIYGSDSQTFAEAQLLGEQPE